MIRKDVGNCVFFNIEEMPWTMAYIKEIKMSKQDNKLVCELDSTSKALMQLFMKSGMVPDASIQDKRIRTDQQKRNWTLTITQHASFTADRYMPRTR